MGGFRGFKGFSMVFEGDLLIPFFMGGIKFLKFLKSKGPQGVTVYSKNFFSKNLYLFSKGVDRIL